MMNKAEIKAAALDMGFADAGFTTADPFDSHREFLEAHRKDYSWAEGEGLALLTGCDPGAILPGARAVIVLLHVYADAEFPKAMESHFGRCYLDDDRVTKDGLARRIRQFRDFLKARGIAAKVPFNLPHRMAAARAGLGTFGKNGLFYSARAARQSSWNLPIAVVVDRPFEPDPPSLGMGCPQWCRNACIAACPTRALKGNGRVDPKKCISFRSYFETEMTPVELREPMGLCVYGCDRCQEVCPRNTPWLSKDLPVSRRVAAKAPDFELPRLLHMDKVFFKERIRPHMFYIPAHKIWLWKMNAARAMGNTLDPCYRADLILAFEREPDSRVQGMAAWALGRIGGEESRKALEKFLPGASGPVLEEVRRALQMI